MADVHTKEIRSYNMSRIRGRNTKPEMLVRRFLHTNGFRYKLHDKSLPGKPDIVLPKYKTVILVHGCFWHGHTDCKLNRIPKKNYAYWEPKITGNAKRDSITKRRLSKIGWKIITVRECQLHKSKLDKTLNKLLEYLMVSHD